MREPKRQRPAHKLIVPYNLQQEPSSTWQITNFENTLLAHMRVTARTTKVQPQLPQEAASIMTSHSNKTLQVSFQPFSLLTCFLIFSYNVNFTNSMKCNVYQNKHKHTKIGKTQQYEIIRFALTPQIKPHIKTKDNPMLTLKCNILLHLQDQDHDMADSSSSTSNKRSQLTIHQHSQQKKTRCDLQANHDKYANQTLWLGFQTLECLAKDNAIQPIEISISIRELLLQGYKESEAAKFYTAKISYLRVQLQRWPSSRQDGRIGHYYHLTQVPLDIDINTTTSFALVYYILLNFEKPYVAYTSLEVIEMTKA